MTKVVTKISGISERIERQLVNTPGKNVVVNKMLR